MRVRDLPRTGGMAYWLSWIPILIALLIVGALLAGAIAGAQWLASWI